MTIPASPPTDVQTPPGRDRGRLPAVAARLPLPLLQMAGAAVGTLWYACLRTHRNTVLRNIAFAFPQWDANRVKRTSRQAFRHFGTVILEVLQCSAMTRRQIIERCRLEGETHLTEALALKKGVVLVSAHLGNWEVGLQFLNCHSRRRIVGVAKKFKNKWLNDWVHRFRTRMGNRILYKKGALPLITDTLRQGGVTAIHIDMSRQQDGIDIEFFGRKATATPAASLIALRGRCPLLPAVTIREPDGKILIRIGEPIALVRTGSLREDLRVNTQILTDGIERTIRAYPDQWWWLQKRWKDYYPELYPEYLRSRRKRLKRRLERKRRLKEKL